MNGVQMQQGLIPGISGPTDMAGGGPTPLPPNFGQGGGGGWAGGMQTPADGWVPLDQKPIPPGGGVSVGDEGNAVSGNLPGAGGYDPFRSIIPPPGGPGVPFSGGGGEQPITYFGNGPGGGRDTWRNKGGGTIPGVSGPTNTPVPLVQDVVPPGEQAQQGTWLDEMDRLINTWKDDYMGYNENQANRIADRYRVTGEDIANTMSQVAAARANSGIMGGTEDQNLMANALNALRGETQGLRTNALSNAWGLNANALNSAMQGQSAARELAQQGNVAAQTATMNAIAQALMGAPSAAGSQLGYLASLLGLGNQSRSNSSSYQEDPTWLARMLPSIV
jgi:hypothetical protein